MTILDDRPETSRTDPRLRARQAEIARAKGRRRLKVLIVAFGLAAFLAGATALLHSSLFGARHVTVAGAIETGRAAVLAAAGLSGAPPLVDVNDAQAAQRVERLPWVATATVTRSFPDSVTVRVTERVAIAEVARPGGGVALVDATGRVLADEARAQPGLVIVHGLVTIPPPGSSFAASGRAGALAAGAVPASLVDRVAAAVVSPSGSLSLDLLHGPRVLLGSTSALRDKMVALATVLARVDLAHVAVIDLRVPADPVLTS